jgi:hypothetical protein
MRTPLILSVFLTASLFAQSQNSQQTKTITTCVNESVAGGNESQALRLESSGTVDGAQLLCSNSALDNGKFHDCPVSVPEATTENSENRRCGTPGKAGDNCADMSVERCDSEREGVMSTYSCTVKNANGAHIKNMKLCIVQK